jgi:hypothetical protein
MKFGASLCSCTIRSLKSCSFEQELHLPHSSWERGEVGVVAIADTVVTMPIPGEKMDSIFRAVAAGTAPVELADVMRRLFWSPRPNGPNSLILFLGEFKKNTGLPQPKSALHGILHCAMAEICPRTSGCHHLGRDVRNGSLSGVFLKLVQWPFGMSHIFFTFAAHSFSS